jgi:fructose-1,6-bisphosphatase I
MPEASWTPPDASRAGATLETFILEGMFQVPGATGMFTSLLNQISLAAKLITGRVRRAGLADVLGWTGETNVQGESVQKLDIIANETLLAILRRRGHCAGIASEELEHAVFFPNAISGYLVVADPLDGSSNIDVNISIGTIFGIIRMKKGEKASDQSFLVKGSEYAAAGYVIYGSSTVLMLSTGKGVHGFTWDPGAGEFFLSHENVKCPAQGNIYSVNEGNASRWSEGVQRWCAEVKTTHTHRYVGSLVADAHRTLLKGGIFAYPADKKSPLGKLRLLYEANPMAFIFEAAGGRAITGTERVLDVLPTELHQRVPLIVGSPTDVAAFERTTAGK